MGQAKTAPRVVLACGEVRTSLLPALQALDSRAAAQLLGLRADERVLLSERPNLYGRSPDTLTGVDCPLPSANGARVRAVGTVAARAALTEGRLLQTSAYFTMPATGPDHRQPWGHYLVRPGVVEPFGKLPHEAVAAGVLNGGRHGDLDVGLIADGLHTRLLRHPCSTTGRPSGPAPPGSAGWPCPRNRAPARRSSGSPSPRTSCARYGSGCPRAPPARGSPGSATTSPCTTGCSPPWSASSTASGWGPRRGGRSTAGPAAAEAASGAGEELPAVVRALRPAVDHLLHLWMPRARVAQELAPLWDALEERPGFTRQWQTLVQRIRDQLTLHAIPSPHRETDMGP